MVQEFKGFFIIQFQDYCMFGGRRRWRFYLTCGGWPELKNYQWEMSHFQEPNFQIFHQKMIFFFFKSWHIVTPTLDPWQLYFSLLARITIIVNTSLLKTSSMPTAWEPITQQRLLWCPQSCSNQSLVCLHWEKLHKGIVHFYYDYVFMWYS